MKTTLEISMYPLSDQYIDIVVNFVDTIKKNHPEIRIETNGLSTQVFADYDTIMQIFQNEIKEYLSAHKSVFVFKLASGEHTPESVHATIKN
ncbi:MAG: hypothetical protein ACPG4Z_07505 [Chitinophagales bacterium]